MLSEAVGKVGWLNCLGMMTELPDWQAQISKARQWLMALASPVIRFPEKTDS